MDHVGRGRARGGRILEISESGPGRGMSHGRIMVGRGISVVRPVKPKEDPSVHLDPASENSSDHGNDDPKKILQDVLLQFQRTKNGSFIHITLDYFSASDDVKYYIDKIIEFLLKCSFMVEKFTMEFKLITLLKTFGPQIKLRMFSKLQTTFQQMLILMEDSTSLSTVDRESVVNLCDLLGQLYFRFRVNFGDPLRRYTVLAEPALRCMSHLLKVRDKQHLLVLLKLIAYNYWALRKVNLEKMEDFSIDIRSEMSAVTQDNFERVLLLCALDLTLYPPSKLPPLITEFYMNEIGPVLWNKTVPSSPTQMLATIPEDIVDRISEFDVTLDEYNKHKFVAL